MFIRSVGFSLFCEKNSTKQNSTKSLARKVGFGALWANQAWRMQAGGSGRGPGPLCPHCSEVSIRNAFSSHSSVEHLACTKSHSRCTAETSSSIPDGAVQGKHHLQETLRHMWPRLGLKGPAFYVENFYKSSCFYKLGRQEGTPSNDILPPWELISFPSRIHLAWGLADFLFTTLAWEFCIRLLVLT